MTTKPKAVITVGISGSGKTTWAHQQNDRIYQILCRDDIRQMITNHKTDGLSLGKNLWQFYKWKWEKEVSEIVETCLSELIADKENVIIADTNLRAKYRQPLIDLFEAAGYEVTIQEFPITFEEAVRRDLYRLNSVGKDVIYKQWLQWQEYIGNEPYKPNESLPAAIICDIDGTIAHMNGKRGPFEWHKVGVDDVDRDVRFIVEQYRSALDAQLIFLSGRDGICQPETEQWLFDHHIKYDHLFMRSEGDQRKDYIVKRELFDNHIRDKYDVLCVFDDRPQVVRNVWIPLGLKTITLGDPFLEF